ncbi:MAG: hypothetical protein ACE5JX_07045 [Acidobacteriota bacterium]
MPCERNRESTKSLTLTRSAMKEAGAILCLMLALTPSGRAQEFRVEAQLNPQDATFVLAWSSPVGLRVSRRDRDLLLSFQKHLGDPRLDQVADRLSPWIEGMRAGYDTLLIRFVPGVAYELFERADRIIVELARVSPPATEPGESGQAAIRLDLLQAQLFAETGHVDRARRVLRELDQKHPDTPEILANLAGVESLIHHRRRASALYRKARNLAPHNEDILVAQEGILQSSRPRFTIDFFSRNVERGQLEKNLRLSAWSPIGHLTTGFSYDRNEVEIEQVRRRDGTRGSFDGVRRRAKLFLEYDFEAGSSLQGEFYSQDGSSGYGLLYTSFDVFGTTRVAAHYRKPYWESVEGLINGAVRDRFQLERSQQLTARLAARAAVALNRYHLGGRDEASSSVALEAGVRYQFPGPPLVIEYGLDAEYQRSSLTLLDSSGQSFNPFPLESREIHFVDAGFEREWSDSIRAGGFAGFSWDRMGGSGPFLGVRLDYEGSGHLGGRVEFDRRLNSVDTGQKVNRIALSLLWRF